MSPTVTVPDRTTVTSLTRNRAKALRVICLSA